MNNQLLQRIKRKLFGKLLSKKDCQRNFQYDFKSYFSNCLDGSKEGDQLLASILLNLHQLEKGMSFTKSARIFGEEKALHVVKNVNTYLKKHEANNVIALAINVLNEYLKNPNSTKNEKSRTTISALVDANKHLLGQFESGTKVVSEPHGFDENVIRDFFFSRSSVREFSEEPISDEEIKKVMDFASCTPTACNRQTSRVHVYRDRKQMNALIENQLGYQNWCDNAKAIFVITSNVSYFNSSYEHLQALVDGGLYAMNFDWGLHLCHIASCYKMYVRLPEIDNEFHKISGIPENEWPVVLILAGHYKKEPIISPKSVRLPVESGSNLFIH